MFYGKTWISTASAGHVEFHRLTESLLVVMTALFLIALDAILEPEPARTSSPSDTQSAAPYEPEILPKEPARNRIGELPEK